MQETVILFLHAPIMEFSVDYNTFKTGPRFKGLRVERGIHLLQYSTGEQKGFFVQCETDLIVFDYKDEEFVREFDQDQLNRIRYNLVEFDPCLGYISEQKTIDTWKSLVKYLRLENLKILPRHMNPITCSSYHSTNGKNSVTINNQTVEDATSNELKDQISFVQVNFKQSFPKEDPLLRTKYSMDKSYLLGSIFKQTSKEFIIGEIALSFILFHLCHIYDGFEQWKVLVTLVCNSSEAIQEHCTFFLHFIDLLELQLQEFPIDFFTDELSSTSFLVDALHTLSLNCREFPNLIALQDAIDHFVGFLDSKFNWDLSHNIVDLEEGEYAPVIVDL